MTANLMPLVKQQFSQNGVPVAGGKLFVYAAGTTTKATTFADSTGITPNTNPVILDANGQASVWLSPTQYYKFILSPPWDTDPPTASYWTVDNVTAPSAVAVGNMTDEKGSGGSIGFVAGTDFVAGTTTSLTLSQAYGSTSNIWVAFDGVPQGGDTFTLSGYTLNFNAPIPAWTNKVYVKGGNSLTVGTPGSGSVTYDAIASGFSWNRPKSSNFWADVTPAVIVHRFNDRIFLGAATDNDGYLHNGASDWLTQSVAGTTSDAQLAALSTVGYIGILAGSRTSDNSQAGSQGSIALTGFSLNNNSTQVQTSYSGYFEARRSIGAGITHGIEIDLINLGSVVSVDPYAMEPVGITTNLWLSAGRTDVVGCTNNTLAVGIINNGAAYEAGIMFQSNSIDTSSGEGGAIVLPANYGIIWYGSAGTKVSRVRCDATTQSISMVFSNGAVNWQYNSTNVLGLDTTGRLIGNNNLTLDASSGTLTLKGSTVNLTNLPTSSTATAGTAGLPTNAVGFIQVQINGSNFKIPYYNV